MTETEQTRRLTVFADGRQIAAGPEPQIAVQLLARLADPDLAPPVVIDDATGRSVDIDLRQATTVAPKPGRGRPRLGVVAREVTLLPRQWDWLASQPGGASVALRRLVDEARRASRDSDRERRARDAAYHAMSVLAGDLPGFEEASRALFNGDSAAFRAQISGWPQDVTAYLHRLLSDRPED